MLMVDDVDQNTKVTSTDGTEAGIGEAVLPNPGAQCHFSGHNGCLGNFLLARKTDDLFLSFNTCLLTVLV